MKKIVPFQTTVYAQVSRLLTHSCRMLIIVGADAPSLEWDSLLAHKSVFSHSPSKMKVKKA